jgi:hypothetical protein
LALLLALAGLSGVSAILWRPSAAPPGVSLLAAERLFAAVQGLAGVAAAWAIWSYRRWAPEAFVGWAAVGLVNVAYYTAVTVPQVVHAFAATVGVRGPVPVFPVGALLLQLATYAGVLGVVYWYLTARRRPERTLGAAWPATR